MDFASFVKSYVSQIPHGKVSTYNQIAQAMGAGTTPNAVGQALRMRKCSAIRYKVISEEGKVSPDTLENSTSRLRMEGIPVENGKIPQDWLDHLVFRDFTMPQGWLDHLKLY